MTKYFMHKKFKEELKNVNKFQNVLICLSLLFAFWKCSNCYSTSLCKTDDVVQRDLRKFQRASFTEAKKYELLYLLYILYNEMDFKIVELLEAHLSINQSINQIKTYSLNCRNQIKHIKLSKRCMNSCIHKQNIIQNKETWTHSQKKAGGKFTHNITKRE